MICGGVTGGLARARCVGGLLLPSSRHSRYSSNSSACVSACTGLMYAGSAFPVAPCRRERVATVLALALAEMVPRPGSAASAIIPSWACCWFDETYMRSRSAIWDGDMDMVLSTLTSGETTLPILPPDTNFLKLSCSVVALLMWRRPTATRPNRMIRTIPATANVTVKLEVSLEPSPGAPLVSRLFSCTDPPVGSGLLATSPRS